MSATAQIVIIGCGSKKRPYPCKAYDMYWPGQYFRATWKAALALRGSDDFAGVYILSAKYGLLSPADVIEPYDLTLGQPGAVEPGKVSFQAAQLGVLFKPVTALCGSRYADLACQVWPHVERPLAGLGIGRQLQALARMAACASS